MGKWTAEVILDPIEFDGDTIVFTVKRILAEDMGIVMKHYKAGPDGTAKLTFSDAAEMSVVVADVFPKYVTHISGMNKADGVPFTIDEFVQVAKENYFVPLIGQIFSGLMAASTVQDLKNSATPAPEQPTV